MGLIVDIWRYAATLLGVRYVVLIDHDGDRHIARVFFRGGQACAERIGFGLRLVLLADDGKLLNGHYVDRWEPYHPFARREWPTWNRVQS